MRTNWTTGGCRFRAHSRRLDVISSVRSEQCPTAPPRSPLCSAMRVRVPRRSGPGSFFTPVSTFAAVIYNNEQLKHAEHKLSSFA